MYNNRYIDYRSHWLINFEEELKVLISKLGGKAGAGCGECGGGECEERISDKQTTWRREGLKRDSMCWACEYFGKLECKVRVWGRQARMSLKVEATS